MPRVPVFSGTARHVEQAVSPGSGGRGCSGTRSSRMRAASGRCRRRSTSRTIRPVTSAPCRRSATPTRFLNGSPLFRATFRRARPTDRLRPGRARLRCRERPAARRAGCRNGDSVTDRAAAAVARSRDTRPAKRTHRCGGRRRRERPGCRTNLPRTRAVRQRSGTSTAGSAESGSASTSAATVAASLEEALAADLVVTVTPETRGSFCRRFVAAPASTFR